MISALAIEVSVITFMWVSGAFVGTVGGTRPPLPLIQILDVVPKSGTDDTVIMFVSNEGDVKVTPDKVYIDDVEAAVLRATEIPAEEIVTIEAKASNAIEAGLHHIFKIVCKDGSTAVMQSLIEQSPIAIESVALKPGTSDTLVILLHNIGDTKITLDKVYIDGVEASLVGAGEIAPDGTLSVEAKHTSVFTTGTTTYMIKVCFGVKSAYTSWTR